MSDKQPFDRPTVYRIRIKGHLDASWSDWLEKLNITPQAGGESLLCGLVTDQAALYGLLKKLRDMGLGLISVIRVECDPGKAVPKTKQIGGTETTSAQKTTRADKQQNQNKEVQGHD